MKEQLKQQWLKLSTKLDAMTLRERVMVFCAVVAGLIFIVYTLSFEPMQVRQKLLETQVKQQQNQINGIDSEITMKAEAYANDPDAPVRKHLETLRKEIAHTSGALMTVQKGLVAPDQIAPLLEHLLHGNGKLKLISMKSLPVTGMNQAGAAAAAGVAGAPATPAAPGAAGPGGMLANVAGAAVNAAVGAALPGGLPGGAAGVGAGAAGASAGQPAVAKPRELLYRHGVELVLQGSYLDMISYMDALESLPVQLFWGKARLDAGQYPNSRLSLTLYTLSLDEKWMKL